MKLCPYALLPLALVLTLGCYGSESEAAGPGPSSEAPADAVPDEVPSAELDGADVNEVFELQEKMVADTADVLKSVTDVESARSARSSLEAIAKRAEPLRRRRAELAGGTAEDKLALARSAMGMMSEISRLSEEFVRLEEIPGVRDELQPAMDKILAVFNPSAD